MVLISKCIVLLVTYILGLDYVFAQVLDSLNPSIILAVSPSIIFAVSLFMGRINARKLQKTLNTIEKIN